MAETAMDKTQCLFFVYSHFIREKDVRTANAHDEGSPGDLYRGLWRCLTSQGKSWKPSELILKDV